eukprot:CAMPEP_0197046064 /NCGR_PEP_ID=MMETSP1384-20130603/21820_1 /TAXON_ID=29189 /ORGANISM="Ammonia sp." /LENGTH=411 /DNA_ID=CAMNT_0042477775 /DNA_START=14 /DNA_END=1249 /DNA_ORIENTATION=+
MYSMDKLLGQTKASAQEIEVKFAKCKQQIAALVPRIRAKLQEKDDSVLSKFNEHYTKLLQSEAPGSDEHEAKYLETQPIAPIPSQLRPPCTFPIENAEKRGKSYASFALQHTLKAHSKKIQALRWSMDSQQIVTAAQDATLIVWDMQFCRSRLGIPLRMNWMMTVDFSPDAQLIAAGGLDNLCSVYSIEDRIGWAAGSLPPHRELQIHEGYIACSRFIDNEHILTASGDSSCILWDIEYSQPIASFIGHSGDVECVAHNFESKHTFLSASIDMTTKLWDYRLKSHQSCINTFTGHASDVNAVQWFPDYKAFGTASDDGCCRLYDLAANQTLNVYGDKLKESNGVTSVDFSKSGYYLVAGYDDEPTCLSWNTVTAKVEKMMTHPNKVSALQFQPNGKSLCTGCWDNCLRVWV